MVLPELMKKFGYVNRLQVPVLDKVVINSGLNATLDRGAIDDTVRDITLIAGQKAVLTKARKSISNFKLREGMPIGVKVTLRGARMWEFTYRFLNIALPNIRDFRGVSPKLDGQGNYTFGVDDHTIFPEISVDGQKRTLGMDISFVTTASSDEQGSELLRLLGMPFRKPQSAANEAAA